MNNRIDTALSSTVVNFRANIKPKTSSLKKTIDIKKMIPKFVNTEGDSFTYLGAEKPATLSKAPKTPLLTKPIATQTSGNQTFINTIDDYSNKILEIALNEQMSEEEKINRYTSTLATAYLDGYRMYDLGTILNCQGCLEFNQHDKNECIKGAIYKAREGNIEQPLEYKTALEIAKSTITSKEAIAKFDAKRYFGDKFAPTQTLEQDIIEMYNGGMKIRKIAEFFNCKPRTITNIVHKNK